MIREQELRNCPITTDDANHALKIYGTNVDALRGKTTWTTPEHVPSNQLRPALPFEILDAHKEVTLCVDLVFVDGITFLGSVSRNKHFTTAERLPTRSMVNVLAGLERINNLYKARGFKITMIHADGEFASLRNELLKLDNIGLNIAAERFVPSKSATALQSADYLSNITPSC
jgi:hypothetical protein